MERKSLFPPSVGKDSNVHRIHCRVFLLLFFFFFEFLSLSTDEGTTEPGLPLARPGPGGRTVDDPGLHGGAASVPRYPAARRQRGAHQQPAAGLVAGAQAPHRPGQPAQVAADAGRRLGPDSVAHLPIGRTPALLRQGPGSTLRHRCSSLNKARRPVKVSIVTGDLDFSFCYRYSNLIRGTVVISELLIHRTIIDIDQLWRRFLKAGYVE